MYFRVISYFPLCFCLFVLGFLLVFGLKLFLLTRKRCLLEVKITNESFKACDSAAGSVVTLTHRLPEHLHHSQCY